jgi:hypothetical protein
MNDIAEASRLFWRLAEIEDELKGREGDQRRVLLSLYDHPNAQVRLKAVKATLAVAPEIARKELQAIADSREISAGWRSRHVDQKPRRRHLQAYVEVSPRAGITRSLSNHIKSRKRG